MVRIFSCTGSSERTDLAQFPDIGLGLLQGLGHYSADLPFCPRTDSAYFSLSSRSGKRTGAAQRLSNASCRPPSQSEVTMSRSDFRFDHARNLVARLFRD